MQERTRKIVTFGLIGLAVAVATITAISLTISTPGPGLLVNPGGLENQEALNLMSSSLNSSTNATLTVLNTGAASNGVTLKAYYVHSGQNQYANPNWAGPSIAKGAQVSFNILIDGQAFTFQPGNSYSIEVVTARNNLFTFTLTT